MSANHFKTCLFETKAIDEIRKQIIDELGRGGIRSQFCTDFWLACWRQPANPISARSASSHAEFRGGWKANASLPTPLLAEDPLEPA